MNDDTHTAARIQIVYDWLRAHHPDAAPEVHIQRGPDGLVVLQVQKQTNPPNPGV